MNADHTHPSNEASAPANGGPDASAAGTQAHVDAAFDGLARACHDASLQRLSARAQARLAQARRPAARPAPRHRAAWAVPTVLAAVAVLAIVLQWRPDPSGAAPATGPAVAVTTSDAASSDPAAALDENPDFYLWLASTDDTMPTTPEY